MMENFGILLDRAIHYATKRHAGQKRKGSDMPYITHPLEVMSILQRMNADPQLMIAGLLHDCIEDTEATEQEIASLFGSDVAELVMAHTDDKSKSWEERKTLAVAELAQAPRRVRMLVMADKISNLRSMAADSSAIGDRLWERFAAPKWRQSRYYSDAQDALCDMQFDPDCAAAYWEMVGLYKDVFVSYLISDGSFDEEYLLQTACHGPRYRLDRGDPNWYEPDPGNVSCLPCRSISRRDAEFIEEVWKSQL